MFKHNLAAVLNKQRKDKHGLYPLRIRATINRVVSYYPTGIMLTEDQWTGTEVIKHPSRVLYNAAIRTKINEIEKTFLEQSISGDMPKRIKKIVSPTFKEFTEKIIKDQTGNFSKGTIDKKVSYLKKFNTFSPGIRLKEITKDTLIAFEKYCRIEGNSDNTIHSNTAFVKSVLNEARKAGYLQVSPGQDFEGAKYSDPIRTNLTQSEIDLFEKYALDETKKQSLVNVCNWFLLSVYTGLRYGDLKLFSGIHNDTILLKTEKTGSIVSIAATNNTLRVYKRITRPVISNQPMNDALKVIAADLGIKKNVTCHTGRHTFSCLFLQKGGRMETLQKFLGHGKIATTLIYGKITNVTANEELKRIWND